ncbi:hypothetical protein [Mycobacterium lepromatosis]|nr:hypothetical protein [Mycobacterium lepromatosis]
MLLAQLAIKWEFDTLESANAARTLVSRRPKLLLPGCRAAVRAA